MWLDKFHVLVFDWEPCAGLSWFDACFGNPTFRTYRDGCRVRTKVLSSSFQVGMSLICLAVVVDNLAMFSMAENNDAS